MSILSSAHRLRRVLATVLATGLVFGAGSAAAAPTTTGVTAKKTHFTTAVTLQQAKFQVCLAPFSSGGYSALYTVDARKSRTNGLYKVKILQSGARIAHGSGGWYAGEKPTQPVGFGAYTQLDLYVFDVTVKVGHHKKHAALPLTQIRVC
jgi:hypothetical protein